jgi:hypothetical protein
MTFFQLVPDSWLTAWQSMCQLRRAARSSAYAWTKMLVGSTPFVITMLVVTTHIDHVLSENFYVSVITVCGIVAGFLMSLMLATGRPPSAEMDIHDARKIRERIIYLLWGHTLTLSAFIITMILAIVALILTPPDAAGPGVAENVKLSIQALCLSLLATGVLRALFLLPYQMFELQEFQLDIFVASARSRNEQRIANAKAELHRLHSGPDP